MGIQTHFEKFHDQIKLGREDDAYKKARDRDDSIKAEVKTAFSEAGYPVVADFIQGSLKMHTGIVPISGDYDIDRALVIDEEKAPENPVTPKKKALARTIHGDRDLAPGRRHRNRTRSRTTGNEQWAAAGTSQPRVAGWLSAEWT